MKKENIQGWFQMYKKERVPSAKKRKPITKRKKVVGVQGKIRKNKNAGRGST